MCPEPSRPWASHRDRQRVIDRVSHAWSIAWDGKFLKWRFRGRLATMTRPTPPLTAEYFVVHCQREGFTVSEAVGFFGELAALASPCQFEPQRLRRTPWLRALAYWHRQFRREVENIRTPAQWRAYQLNWSVRTFDGPHAHGGTFFRTGDARRFLSTHWPLLTLGEPVANFEQRQLGAWPVEQNLALTWDSLSQRVNHPRLLGRLLAALERRKVPRPEPPDTQSWVKVLRDTGLRSVRVHWAEGEHAKQPIALQLLRDVQTLLAEPLGWTGPTLGLAGATGLELVVGDGSGSGQVRLDPFATGQTLVVDDWGVMAHEWLHTLDATLARDCHQSTRWMTLGLAEDPPSLPEQPILAQAGSAWWDQVSLVQFEPLPAETLGAVTQEMGDWAARFRQTMGAVPGLESRLAEEMKHWAAGHWNEEQAMGRWHDWLTMALPEADEALSWRTAQLFSAEMGMARQMRHLEGPLWASFLRDHTHDRGLEIQAPLVTQQRYLSSPIEMMARSFEAAFGPHDGAPNPVWQVTRSSAGMVWPLMAERAYQREGWIRCFEALEPWWALRQATARPLSMQPVKRGITT